MNAIRFFTDEDVQGAVAVQLRSKGFDAISTVEANRLGQSDGAQLSWAFADGRVLLTYNVGDFARIHAEWITLRNEHAGIVVSSQRTIGDAIRRLLHLAQTLSAGEMGNRLEYLSDW